MCKLKIELANQKQNTDSVDSFVLNEKEIELRTMQKKYEKSMERVVKLEDHIMALGLDLNNISSLDFSIHLRMPI